MKLVATKYNPIQIRDVLAFIKGEQDLPRRPVVVTFDDGYEDNAEVAAEIMEKLRISAVFYPAVGAIDSGTSPWFCRTYHAFSRTRQSHWTDEASDASYDLRSGDERNAARRSLNRRCAATTFEEQEELVRSLQEQLKVSAEAVESCMLCWDDLRQLRSNGHSIGAHTVSHPNLALLNEKNVLSELIDSKRRLETQLGESVDSFAYPNPIIQPHWNEITMEATRQAGFLTAVTSTSGCVSRQSDPHCIYRVRAPRTVHELKWSLDLAFLGVTP